MLSLLIAPKLRADLGKDRTALQRRLQRAENLVQRVEENIAFQRQMITTLDRDGHDVKAAKMFLWRLEATHAKHVADRDRLFRVSAARALRTATVCGRRRSWLMAEQT